MEDIKQRVRLCGRCIRRKTAPTKAAELVNITSSAPMELVCIDFLSLEKSKGGHENILVITDHFSRYAQAIPIRNQKATTTAKVLFENFFLHYGFPAVLHSDKGANFEWKVIRKLCEIASVKKSRTTPYHPMGNGMVERYNKTLLNMLGTLSDNKKSDWKSHVSTMTHAYNAAEHESTGYAPFYLMFGRHPRLAIDAFLGLTNEPSAPRRHQDYSDQLQHRLEYAYNIASEEARKAAKKHKKYYDKKVRHVQLIPGDRVLIRKVGLKGKQKLADIWDREPYIVKRQPVPDIPVYEVQLENSRKKSKLLHRNMLLPFNGLPVPRELRPAKPPRKKIVVVTDDSYQPDDSSSSTELSDEIETPVQRKERPQRRNQKQKQKKHSSETADDLTDTVPAYVTPQRNSRQEDSDSKISSSDSSTYSTSSHRETVRRGARQRQPPLWMRTDQWQLQHQPYTILVDPSWIVNL